jgi:hypothetical protein
MKMKGPASCLRARTRVAAKGAGIGVDFEVSGEW